MIDSETGGIFYWTGAAKAKVWNILHRIFNDHSSYQYMKPFKKNQLGTKTRHLGPNNDKNMATRLEAELESLA